MNLEKSEVPNLKYYKFHDGEFSFWQITVNGDTHVFRVRKDTKPGLRAVAKGFPRGENIFPVTNPEYIKAWLKSHPDYPLIGEN